MFEAVVEKIKSKFFQAHAEATWLVEGIKEKRREGTRDAAKKNFFDDIFSAAMYFSNPKFGFLPEEIEEELKKVSLRIMQRNAELSRTDPINTSTAVFIARRRLAGR